MPNKNIFFRSILAISCSTLLTGCGGAQVESDEDFLASVRNAASQEMGESENPGLIDPNVQFPAKIELETDYLDMGYIPLGEITQKEIRIYNRGKKPLIMGSIDSSCACTTGVMEKSIIAPGESEKLIVTVDPRKFEGVEALKALTIYSNAPIDTQVFLAVRSRISGELKRSAESFEFGTLSTDESAKQSIIVTQTRPETVLVKEIIFPKGSSEFITVIVKEVPESEWKDPERAEHELVAQVVPGLKPGNYTLETMVLFDHERYQQYTFSVNVIVQ